MIFIGPNMQPAPIVMQGEGKKTAVLALGALVGRGEGYFENKSPYASVRLFRVLVSQTQHGIQLR